MCPSKNFTNKPHLFVQMNIEVNFLRPERQVDTIDHATNTAAPSPASSDNFTENYDSFWDYEDTIIDISDASSTASSCKLATENEHRVLNNKTSCISSLEGDMFLYLSDPNNRFMNYLLEDDHDADEDENESKREQNNRGLDISYNENSGASKTKSISAVRRKRLSTEAHPDMILFHLLEAEKFCKD
ncbi:hypothetical protein ACHAXS_002254 [Conticribra weissflogii]